MAVYSFASSACVLPPPVIEAISRDVTEWGRTGQSVVELPFAGREFGRILADAERDLRMLLELPNHYHVLFLQGGASTQFALLPMNLLGTRECAAYIETGHWSRRAMAEADHWCRVTRAAHGDGLSLPDPSCWQIPADAAYCHFTSNESADGLQYRSFDIDSVDVPLIADMSADFLSRPIKVDRFGLIYASGQKSLGAAGLTVVIVRDDLIGLARKGTPAPLNYARQAAERSKVNTPPTFAVAVAGHMLRWTVEQGGIGAMTRRNRRKSEMLYAAMDGEFFHCPIAPRDRSRISVRFHLPDAETEARFLREAEANGFLHLRGHPAVGGLRASLYNGATEEAVAALTVFMAGFRDRYG